MARFGQPPMAASTGSANSLMGTQPGYLSDIYTSPECLYYPLVVWQFWGRAAEASCSFRALFLLESGQWSACGVQRSPAFLTPLATAQGFLRPLRLQSINYLGFR